VPALTVQQSGSGYGAIFIGNVGIGTTTPPRLLTIDAGATSTIALGVNGSANFTGTVNQLAGGVDLAEAYKIDPQCYNLNNCPEPGDIVSIAENLTIQKASSPYDPKLIGVISTRPGFAMWDSLDATSSRLVALVGKASVKVSTERGPIEVGDALTSSNQPGMAMKATEPGRVIGIALESFGFEGFEFPADEVGRITAFINPHWTGNDLSVIQDDQDQIVQADLQKDLTSLGLIVTENGSLKVQKLKAKIAEVEYFQTKDKVTGEIYCIWIENGEWIKVKGECESVNSGQGTMNNEPPAEEPPAETSTE